MSLITAWVKLLVLAAVAAAVVAGCMARDAGLREEGAATERAVWQERDRLAAEAGTKETQRRLERQETSNRETRQRLDAARDAERRERAAAGQLRDELAAADAERRRNPAAVAQCAPAEAAVDLRTDLFGRADAAAGELAAYAQAARLAGEQCERDYDALTGAGPR